MKEIAIPYPTFKEAQSFFQGASEAKNGIATKGFEGRFQNRAVKIPGVRDGTVSRLKRKFTSSNVQSPQTDLPINPKGKKITECIVTQQKKPGSKKAPSDFSKNFAKYLFFKQQPTNLPDYYSPFLGKEIKKKELEISAQSREEMDKSLGLRRCSVFTMNTELFGFSDVDESDSLDLTEDKQIEPGVDSEEYGEVSRSLDFRNARELGDLL